MSEHAVVVISAPVDERYVERLRERFPSVDIRLAPGDQTLATIGAADALVCWNLTSEELAAASRLRWVHRCAAGVEEFLTPEFRARDLILTNSSGVHASNIAEHALAMMLAFARGLPALYRAQQEHKWRAIARPEQTFELGGQTLLVVGYGRIGRALASRASALGMRVLAVHRTADAPTDGVAERLGPLSDLVELLPEADHVVNCLPLTRATERLFDAGTFAAMKRGAYYYSVGRGQTTNTAALIAALDAGTLAGAGLDVVDPEPLPGESPLWDHPNVIITAHTSGATPHMWDRVFAIVEENIARFLAGEPLHNVVDQDRGY
jgi:D-2-hydroxyacid dehydrogenase (NADP+)